MNVSKCVVCGKEFTHKNPRALTCSRECRDEKYRTERMNKEQTCVYCGKKFIGSVSQTYCSDECRTNGRLMRIKKPRPANKMNRIKDIAKEATKNGMTYGTYVAREKI